LFTALFCSQEIYKTVRGVLNKLTPEKFDKLMNVVNGLQIDNKQRMEGVIDLVFNKVRLKIPY